MDKQVIMAVDGQTCLFGMAPRRSSVCTFIQTFIYAQQFPLGLTFCVWGLPFNLSEERLNFFSIHACIYNHPLLLPAIGEV